jgi:hypothetical protein
MGMTNAKPMMATSSANQRARKFRCQDGGLLILAGIHAMIARPHVLARGGDPAPIRPLVYEGCAIHRCIRLDPVLQFRRLHKPLYRVRAILGQANWRGGACHQETGMFNLVEKIAEQK